MAKVKYAYAPPATGARPLELVNSTPDNSHTIKSGDQFTILLKTISNNLYSTYSEKMKSGYNNRMIVLSESGIGAPAFNAPSQIIHSVEEYDYYSDNVTSLWSPGIKWVPDYRAGAEGVSSTENTGRVYLRGSAFCQKFGPDTVDDFKTALAKVLNLVGRTTPTLVPYILPTQAALDGLFLIINKLREPRFSQQIIRTPELALWPAGTGGGAGFAPLRLGSYVLFFGEASIENLVLDGDNIVRPSQDHQEVPPNLVITIVEGLLPLPSAPSESQLSKAQGIDILEKYNSNFRVPSKSTISDASIMLDGISSIGESAYQISLIKRFMYLKALGNNRLESQERRYAELKTRLVGLFPSVGWTE